MGARPRPAPRYADAPQPRRAQICPRASELRVAARYVCGTGVPKYWIAFPRHSDYAAQRRGLGVIAPAAIGETEGCTALLVLTRKSNQSIMIGDDIEVSVLSVVGEKVRIGIQAPSDVPVFRTEIYIEIQRQQGEGKPTEEVRSHVEDAIRDLGEKG
jgi:carbon storage regulator